MLLCFCLFVVATRRCRWTVASQGCYGKVEVFSTVTMVRWTWLDVLNHLWVHWALGATTDTPKYHLLHRA